MANFLDVFEDVTKKGKKISTDEYLESGKYPIIDQGQAYIAGYYNDAEGLFSDVPVIIFGDHTRVLKYVDFPCFLGADGVKLLKAKDQSANYKYLYYALCNARIPNTGYNRHFKWLKEVEIALPDSEAQKQIAATLDKATQTIDLCNAILEKLDLLVKARFVEMFGRYENSEHSSSMEEISEMVTVGIANSATHAYVDDGVIMFRNQNIKEGFLDDEDLIYITEEFAKKYKSKALKENDILVTRTGYPGVACLVPKKYEGCQTFTTLIVRLKPSDRISARFVCHYINSYFGKKYVEGMKVGVAQQNFGAKALDRMPIFLPPIEEQNQFAAFVEQTDKSKFAVQQVLAKAETLKKALMQEYFG